MEQLHSPRHGCPNYRWFWNWGRNSSRAFSNRLCRPWAKLSLQAELQCLQDHHLVSIRSCCNKHHSSSSPHPCLQIKYSILSCTSSWSRSWSLLHHPCYPCIPSLPPQEVLEVEQWNEPKRSRNDGQPLLGLQLAPSYTSRCKSSNSNNRRNTNDSLRRR